MAAVENGSNGSAGHPDKPRVVICGAGVIGASIAYYLSLKGLAATVVERTAVACAASGKAGGFLALDWSDGSDAGPLARRSFQLHEDLGAKFGDKTGYRKVNTFAVKTSSNRKGAQKVTSAARSVLPTWMDGGIASARKMADSSTTAQVHPESLSKTLLEEAGRIGTRIRIGTVEGIQFTDGGRATGVRVDGEILEADVIVIAMGPWTRAAAEWCPGMPRIGGQKAHSVVLQPKAPLTADCIFLDHTSKQGKPVDPEVYPRPDGTVYICGETDSVDPPADPAAIQPRASATASLREVGAAISSSLAGAEMVREQACFLPLSPDGVPAIGPLPGTSDSLYVASGHSCWGILMAPATGEAVADLIAGEAPKIDLSSFSPARFSSSKRYRTCSIAV